MFAPSWWNTILHQSQVCCCYWATAASSGGPAASRSQAGGCDNITTSHWRTKTLLSAEHREPLWQVSQSTFFTYRDLHRNIAIVRQYKNWDRIWWFIDIEVFPTMVSLDTILFNINEFFNYIHNNISTHIPFIFLLQQTRVARRSRVLLRFANKLFPSEVN